MVKCKDGRKHVVVSEYQKKAGTNVSRYERNCPSSRFKPNDGDYFCCICGEECYDDNINNLNIKGETKSICKECVDTIHGLM
jgi:hypothetical protein